jgi:DNA polymerase-3 subunit epsilon
VDFVALDLETANADMASICQIGAARYVGGVLVEEWKTYVDPKDYFDAVNVAIHGINQTTVAGAPIFLQVAAELEQVLGNAVVVTHTHFDRTALHQASSRHGTSPPRCIWLDSARVARRTWTEFAQRGYGLANVCRAIGYNFKHHDALEDAKAAAAILMAASTQTGLDLAGWLRRVEQPINPTSAYESDCKRDGNPNGPLYSEVLVFTGALRIPRAQAADIAANLGCQVAANVTKATTLLVVGDQDIRALAGHTKSSKHRKAEELIANGMPIRILCETDFHEMARLALPTQMAA